MSARAGRTPARAIAVEPDALAGALRARGYSGDPRRDPPCIVAAVVAELRARTDPAPWAHAAPRRPAPVLPNRPWRVPPSLRLVRECGKDRATGDRE